MGILIQQPMNAYELTAFVEERQINKLLKISTPAIYKGSKRLYQSGYLDGKAVREGEHPEKFIYTINQKGKEYFYELMKHYSENIQPFYIDFNVFIWNLNNLSHQDAMTELEELRKGLYNWRDWVTRHEKEASHAPFSVRMIIKQYRMIFFTLTQWIDELIRDYQYEISR